MKRLAFVVAGAALVTAVAPTVPALADGGGPIQLGAPVVAVKSTGGQTLTLMLSANKSSSGTQLSVSLTHHTSAGDETHDWGFSAPGSALSYSSPKGKLVTGTHLGAYGSISLAFTKVSSTTRNCTGYTGKTTVVTTIVKFSGKINFAARDTNAASKWGTVKEGSTTSPYTFGGKKGTYITQSNGPCRVNFPAPPCSEVWSWSVSTGSQSGQLSLEGDSRTSGSTTTSTITAFHGQSLPSPTGASRIDTEVVKAPPPQFNGSANPNTLHASTTAGTNASGGGTLTASGNPANQPGGNCKRSNGTSTTESATFWDATWANDASKLTVAMDIGGSVSVPDGSQGYFTHLTFS